MKIDLPDALVKRAQEANYRVLLADRQCLFDRKDPAAQREKRDARRLQALVAATVMAHIGDGRKSIDELLAEDEAAKARIRAERIPVDKLDAAIKVDP